jgi:DinB superfamily
MNTILQAYFQRLDNEFDSLCKFVSQYSNEELNSKPEPSAWSALQVMHHLLIAERGAFDYVKKKITLGRDSLKKSGATSKLRAMMLTTSLRQPIKLKAPSVAIEGLPEISTLQETESQWRAMRRELREFLSQQSDFILESDCYKHPVTGRMNVWGMLDFFEVHFNRHLKQIKNTIRKVES